MRPIVFVLLAALLCFVPPPSQAAPVSQQIIVDQFGWRADAPRKIVIFADPMRGQNAQAHYVPGPTFLLRRANDGRVIYSGKVTVWQNGQVHDQSGDRVWWGDFSSVMTPGRYVVYDPLNHVQSFPFTLGNGVYGGVLRASSRMFFYQRCGTDIAVRNGGHWTHNACHVGDKQDRAAQLYITGPLGQPRDVSGGWHDAGDYSKYVPFLAATLWDLLAAYELNPQAFSDNEDIPESRNGVPDILDEVKWETDWLLKMQNPDGSVCNRVSVTSYNNGSGPTEDSQPRFRTQPTTWATAVFAASTAHLAREMRPFARAYPGYAARLQSAAGRAWDYLNKNPQMLPADGTDGAHLAAAGADADPQSDRRDRVLAAAELFALTGDTRYKRYFEQYYKDKPATNDGGQQPLADGAIDPARCHELVHAYFTYARTQGADPAIVAQIKTLFQNTMETNLVPNYAHQTDPYRAFMWDGHYCWGSNQLKADWGQVALLAAALNVNPAHRALYREIAEEYLHYFHGRNPLSWVYLTNMGTKGEGLGASKSVMEIYHQWFTDGSPLYDGASSRFGPAPGYLAGGPNQFFSHPEIAPPHGEPPMKAYKDWNTSWNKARGVSESSWEVTEPAIYYQAAYIFLLGAFSPAPARPSSP